MVSHVPNRLRLHGDRRSTSFTKTSRTLAHSVTCTSNVMKNAADVLEVLQM